MKVTIKGITYDTRRAKTLWESKKGKTIYSVSLHQNPSGHFFFIHATFYVNGRRLPNNMPFLKFMKKHTVPRRNDWPVLAPGVEPRHFIKPTTRRKALAFAIRHHMPRVFHKDLARFLK